MGTEFHIIFDFERGDSPAEEMVLPHWDILVVDDDEELCHSAADSLTEIGVHAEWALDGKTAVEMVEKRHNQHKDYYVVLLDCRMPGMDGIETAREMRRRIGADVPILLDVYKRQDHGLAQMYCRILPDSRAFSVGAGVL